MELTTPSQKDLAHRIQEWVMANRTFLLLVLAGGIGFFGLLAGVNAWRHSKETKALEAYYLAEQDPARLKELVETYSGTAPGLLAIVDLAYQEGEQKNWENCIGTFENLYTQAKRQPFFRVLALHGKGSCLRGKGELLQSAQLFERAAKEPGHADPFVSLYEAARSYQMAGEAQGVERLEALLKEEKISPELREKVLEDLLWLRLQKKS